MGTLISDWTAGYAGDSNGRHGSVSKMTKSKKSSLAGLTIADLRAGKLTAEQKQEVKRLMVETGATLTSMTKNFNHQHMGLITDIQKSMAPVLASLKQASESYLAGTANAQVLVQKMKSDDETFSTINEYLKAHPIDALTLLHLQIESKGAVGAQMKAEMDRLKAQQEQAEALLQAAQPDIERGQLFARNQGKKPTSPIRRHIEKLLTRRPELSNEEIWQALKDKPLKGWEALGSRVQTRFLSGPGKQEMNYGTFRNHCTAARKAVKNAG